MKPLSVFAEGLRERKAHTYSSENADHYRGFDAGMAHAADLLQAWLRERHKELDKAEASQSPDPIGPLYGAAISAARKWIREELLGTTRPVANSDLARLPRTECPVCKDGGDELELAAQHIERGSSVWIGPGGEVATHEKPGFTFSPHPTGLAKGTTRTKDGK